MSEEQRHEFERKILDECKGPSEATDDDVKHLLEHEVPQTRSGKCLLSCSQQKLGIVRILETHSSESFSIKMYFSFFSLLMDKSQ